MEQVLYAFEYFSIWPPCCQDSQVEFEKQASEFTFEEVRALNLQHV